MKTTLIAALVALAGAAEAGQYDFAACEMVLEDHSVHHHPANPAATKMDMQLTQRQTEIRSRRNETAIRQLGGWDLVDDYVGATYEINFWLEANKPRLAALPAKAAREELEARIIALCL
jgi:hypothetical protein